MFLFLYQIVCADTDYQKVTLFLCTTEDIQVPNVEHIIDTSGVAYCHIICGVYFL